MLVTGYVEKVSANNGGIWSLKVDNVYYGTYRTEPKCKVGDYVSFEATQKDKYFNADPKTIKLAQPPAKAEPVKEEAPPKAAAPAKSSWVPDKDRQDSITYQSARKDALELTSMLLSAGLVDLGNKASKKADAIGIVEMYVDRFTMRFFEDTKNLKPKAAVTAEVATTSEPVSAGEDADPDATIPW